MSLPSHSGLYRILHDYVISLSTENVYMEKQAIFNESLTLALMETMKVQCSHVTHVYFMLTHTDTKTTTDLFRNNMTSTSRHDLCVNGITQHNCTFTESAPRHILCGTGA